MLQLDILLSVMMLCKATMVNKSESLLLIEVVSSEVECPGHPLGVEPREDVSLLRIEESLHHVPGHGDGGGHRPRHSTGHCVLPRNIFSRRIDQVHHLLIHHEVDSLKVQYYVFFQ